MGDTSSFDVKLERIKPFFQAPTGYSFKPSNGTAYAPLQSSENAQAIMRDLADFYRTTLKIGEQDGGEGISCVITVEPNDAAGFRLTDTCRLLSELADILETNLDV